MISMTDVVREQLAGALGSAMLTGRRLLSVVAGTFQGISVPTVSHHGFVPGANEDGVARSRRVYQITSSLVPAPIAKAPLSGVPAWSPPV